MVPLSRRTDGEGDEENEAIGVARREKTMSEGMERRAEAKRSILERNSSKVMCGWVSSMRRKKRYESGKREGKRPRKGSVGGPYPTFPHPHQFQALSTSLVLPNATPFPTPSRFRLCPRPDSKRSPSRDPRVQAAAAPSPAGPRGEAERLPLCQPIRGDSCQGGPAHNRYGFTPHYVPLRRGCKDVEWRGGLQFAVVCDGFVS